MLFCPRYSFLGAVWQRCIFSRSQGCMVEREHPHSQIHWLENSSFAACSPLLWILNLMEALWTPDSFLLKSAYLSYPVAVKSLQSCPTLWCRGLSLAISQSLPKFMFVASVMPSSHLILWRPLLLLPSVFPSIRDFSNEMSVCIRWPKYCSFNFSMSPSSEYSGLSYFGIDWFDLLAVQGTLKSLL